jgi:DNA-binding IclR family transcriptional regulator
MTALVRALDLLTLVGEAPEALSLTDVSEQAGIPLATAHRLLKALEEQEFVRRDEVTLAYSPGRRLLRLATHVRRETLAQSAQVHLSALSRRFNETAMLTQLVDGRAVCVALAESRRPVHLSVHVGRAVPLHAAASARILYADADRSAVEELLAGYEFTRLRPTTPSGIDDVVGHLEGIRRTGYDVCDNEFDFDMWAVGAPVRDAAGEIVAGVTLVLPQERSAGAELRADIIAAVTETAADIGAAIGGVAVPRNREGEHR